MKKDTIAGPRIARSENTLKAILFVGQEAELIEATESPEPSSIGEVMPDRQSICELVAIDRPGSPRTGYKVGNVLQSIGENAQWVPLWLAVALKRSGFAREQECRRDKSEARIDGTKLSRNPLQLRHNQFGSGIRPVYLSQRGSIPMLDLDDHGTAWANYHNVDFVGLTTRIWMREVGQNEGSVLPFGTTKKSSVV